MLIPPKRAQLDTVIVMRYRLGYRSPDQGFPTEIIQNKSPEPFDTFCYWVMLHIPTVTAQGQAVIPILHLVWLLGHLNLQVDKNTMPFSIQQIQAQYVSSKEREVKKIKYMNYLRFLQRKGNRWHLMK